MVNYDPITDSQAIEVLHAMRVVRPILCSWVRLICLAWMTASVPAWAYLGPAIKSGWRCFLVTLSSGAGLRQGELWTMD